MQGHIQVLLRYREKIARDGLLRLGVKVAPHRRADVGQLIGGQIRTAAKHHVLQSVRRTRETLRRFVRSNQVVHYRGHHGRKGLRTITTRRPLSSVALDTSSAASGLPSEPDRAGRRPREERAKAYARPEL